MLQYFDAHSHLPENFILEKIKKLRHTMDNYMIAGNLVNAASGKEWDKILKIAEKCDLVIPFLGIHPWYASEDNMFRLNIMEDYLADNDCGIGEIGLDMSLENHDQNFQILYFEAQLILAQRYNRPVSIHAVHSDAQVLKMLKVFFKKTDISFMIHSFAASVEIAKNYLNLGAYLSLSPAILAKSKKNVERIVSYIPLESLLLETDSPDRVLNSNIRKDYFASHSVTEFKNSLMLIPEFYKIIAEIKGVDLMTFTCTIAQNINNYLNGII